MQEGSQRHPLNALTLAQSKPETELVARARHCAGAVRLPGCDNFGRDGVGPDRFYRPRRGPQLFERTGGVEPDRCIVGIINLESFPLVRIAAQAIAGPNMSADDKLLMCRAEARIAEDAEFAANDVEQ